MANARTFLDGKNEGVESQYGKILEGCLVMGLTADGQFKYEWRQKERPYGLLVDFSHYFVVADQKTAV